MNTTSLYDTELLASDLLDHIPLGIVHCDVQGVISSVNKAALQILSLDKNQIEGKHASDTGLSYVDQKGAPIAFDELPVNLALTLGKEIKEFVYGVVRSADSVIWISESAKPLVNSEGLHVGVISSFSEVSENTSPKGVAPKPGDRRHHEGSIQAVFWEWSILKEEMIYVGPRVKEILGYSAEERGQKGFWESKIHPDDRKWAVEFHQNQVDQGKSHEFEYRFLHGDGEYIWVRDIIDVIVEEEKAVSLRGLMMDITHQKGLSKELKEIEVRYKNLITEAPFSISIYDPNGNLITANDAFESIWEVKAKNLIGKFNIHKEDRLSTAKMQHAVKRAFSGKKGQFSVQFETVNENVKDLHIKYFPIYNTSNELFNVVFVTEDISARQEAEKKAKMGEALQQGILNSLEDAILVVDKDGTILSINKRLESYLQRSPYKDVELGGNVFSFIDFFEEKDLLRTGLEKVLNRASTIFDYETKLADKKWYNLKVTQLKKPYGAVISWQNINTRKEIEIALEKSLKKYRNIYNRAPVMMHSINSKAEIMSVSDFWLEKMGYERKEVIGRKSEEFLTESSKKSADQQLKEFFQKGHLKNVPYQYKTKSGEILDVLLSATSEYDEEGNFERSLAGMVDVTELRKTERELLESRQNLLEAQRISKIGNYEMDFKANTLTPSSEMVAMMGLKKSSLNLDILNKLIHPQDLVEFHQKLEQCRKSGHDFFHIFRIHHLKSRKVRWISARGKVMPSPQGARATMIGTVQDISEQKVAEDKIRRLSDRILLATELAEIGVWEHTVETGDVYWDKQMYEIFEGADKPLNGFEELREFVIEEDRELLEELSQKLENGARFIEADLRMLINDRVKYLRTYTRIIRDSDARVTRVIGVVYDNTRDKELQVKLEGSLEEKNILLKEVHHRVKNNMQLVSSILALKSYDLKDEESKEIFSEINERIKSMAVIHDQLYKFYNVSEINVSEYLNHIARELRVLMGPEQAQIVVDADDKLFEVDKVLLFGLIVSELVSNAFKHGFGKKKKGTVQVLFKDDGDSSRLAVINDGFEIPQDILKRKSTGLGISLIKTFAKQLNGEVELSDENGFQITF